MPTTKLYAPYARPRADRPHEVAHERLLDRLGETVEDAVDDEERPHVPGRVGRAEPDVDDRVDEPSRRDEARARHPVGEVATEIRPRAPWRG